MFGLPTLILIFLIMLVVTAFFTPEEAILFDKTEGKGWAYLFVVIPILFLILVIFVNFLE